MPVGLYAVLYRRPYVEATIYLVESQTGSDAADELRTAVPGGSVVKVECIASPSYGARL